MLAFERGIALLRPRGWRWVLVLAIASALLALVAARVSGPSGPWLWNWDLPKIDYPLAALFHAALRDGRLPSGATTSGWAFLCMPKGRSGPSTRRTGSSTSFPRSSRSTCRAVRAPGVGRRRDRDPGRSHLGFAERQPGCAGNRRPRWRDHRQAAVDEPGSRVCMAAVGAAATGAPPGPDRGRPGRCRCPVGPAGAGGSSEHVAAHGADGGGRHGRHRATPGDAGADRRLRVSRRSGGRRAAGADAGSHVAVRSQRRFARGRPVHELGDSVRPPAPRLRRRLRRWTRGGLDIANTWYPDGGFASSRRGYTSASRPSPWRPSARARGGRARSSSWPP